MNEQKQIVITAYGSVSPIGWNEEGFFQKEPFIKPVETNGILVPVGSLPPYIEKDINALMAENKLYSHLDRTVLLAILAGRELKKGIQLTGNDIVGINIGSSRGATGVWEKRYNEFLGQAGLKVSVYTSPTTTLGNISSWVMHDLGLSGPSISHSVTCSTAIEAIMNGIAWLRAGMADKFIAGAAEAPLTPFTISQMKSLKIYSTEAETPYPSRPLEIAENRKDTMALGEGAAMFLLEKIEEIGDLKQKDAYLIEGYGFGSENPKGLTGISDEGQALEKAMRMALNQAGNPKIDMLIMHAPGTISGEKAELAAIQSIFGDEAPALYSNKWQTGHTLGAAAAINLLNAIAILKHQKLPEIPYPSLYQKEKVQFPIKRIMLNATGFGGNAGSLIVSKL